MNGKARILQKYKTEIRLRMQIIRDKKNFYKRIIRIILKYTIPSAIYTQTSKR